MCGWMDTCGCRVVAISSVSRALWSGSFKHAGTRCGATSRSESATLKIFHNPPADSHSTFKRATQRLVPEIRVD